MDMTSLPLLAANSTAATDPWDTFMEEVTTYMTFKVEEFIAKYWFPVLIPLGLIGNTLFLVHICSEWRHSFHLVNLYELCHC